MLTLSGVSKVYSNGFRAVAGVDLSVARGEIVALVGGSGCGKSTLLRLVAGLDRPTEGTVSVAGHAVTAPGGDVGVVFQEPRLMPWLPVEANVRFGLAGVPVAEARRRAAAALRRVGLEAFADALPRQLSGGMAQRVAIARALVTNPAVLLLDEPFSALDTFTRHDLHAHVLDIWAADRPTLVLVTHDIDEAVALADRVLVMAGQPGRIVGSVAVETARPRDRAGAAAAEARARVIEIFADHRPDAAHAVGPRPGAAVSRPAAEARMEGRAIDARAIEGVTA